MVFECNPPINLFSAQKLFIFSISSDENDAQVGMMLCLIIGELQSKTILPTSYLANPASYLQRSSLNLYALNMK